MTTLQLALILVALILALIEGARNKWQSLLICAVMLTALALALPLLRALV